MGGHAQPDAEVRRLADARRLARLERDGDRGDAAQGVSRLKDELDGDLFLIGCGELALHLLAGGLVDEVRFWIHPSVWGEGARPYGGDKVKLQLLDSASYDSGVTRVTSRRMTSISPLWVENPREAVAFYEAAFGATALHRIGEGDDIVAQLAIGEAAFWVGGASETMRRLSPRAIDGATRPLLVVEDPDRVVGKRSPPARRSRHR